MANSSKTESVSSDRWDTIETCLNVTCMTGVLLWIAYRFGAPVVSQDLRWGLWTGVGAISAIFAGWPR